MEQQQVNLYQPLEPPPRALLSAHSLLQVLGLALALTLLATVLLGWHNRRLAQTTASLAQQYHRLAARLARLPAGSGDHRLAAALASPETLEALRRVLAGPKGTAPAFSAIATTALEASGKDIRLQRMRITDGGHGLGLDGQARTAAAVVAYLDRLARQPATRGFDLTGIAVERTAQGDLPWHFHLAPPATPGRDADPNRGARGVAR